MKLIGFISTAVLSLIIAVPAYGQQEQNDQQEEKKARPAQDERKAQPEKSTERGNKNGQQEEKNTQRRDRNNNQEEKSAQQQERNNQQENRNARSEAYEPTQQAQHGSVERIPDDRYRANFGSEHRFRVSQADYSNRRFQYGGYSFGFVDAWPRNWLYTQDVFVVEMNGVYYLCNASYPGVNVELSFRE